MTLKPKIIGYFIWPHDGSEGYGSTSLKELLDSFENEINFPFLNDDKLHRLQCRPGVQRSTVNHIDSSAKSNKSGWSPTSRFLHQMFEKGMYEKLEIPSHRLILCTNRKTIIEIITLFQSKNSQELVLKTKLKIQKYGKELKMGYVNQAQMDYFWSMKTSNRLFGLKFGLYLTTEDNKKGKKDATLFSIHCLQIDEVSFIYEAEIDAIQHSKDDRERKNINSIVEIKTQSDKTGTRAAFKKYFECSEINTSPCGQIERFPGSLEEILDPKFLFNFRQGELGNVDKFIYGFFDAQNHSALSCISTEEFNCYPGTLLNHDGGYLLDFVQFLSDNGILSTSYGLTWENWDSWKMTKSEHSVKIEKDGEIIGNIKPWEIV